MLTYVSGNNRVVVHTGGDRINQPIVTKRVIFLGNTAREFLLQVRHQLMPCFPRLCLDMGN
ncbi:Uncharacterised protein [Salmonella enterica subsp. enterica serovar Bovismorbificans]|uniref:Uncharacterized protein n=1 Tax=Salmonella enterica subsp. enterica serovar Bovismorbificans TaxID=58097 RepID=A0A655CDB5_SALET|nr:Uncharacterised protein [Salmonella enterica subsp. enterica serovar Bovismorbificans]